MKSSRLVVAFSLLVISSLAQSGLGAKAKKNGQQQRVARQDDDEDIDLSAELEIDEDGRNLKEIIKSETGTSASEQEGGVALRFKQVIPWKIQHVINNKRKFFTVSTAFTVTTTTVHVTSSTAALCAKLVNVTGPCRLRRGLWVEDPIILSFEDDMDAIDGPLSPTAALRIEPTALPTENRDAVPSSSPSKEVIEPSTTSTASDEEEPDEEDLGGESRLGFRNFLALKHALKKRLKKKHLITIITTTVLTSTATSTDYTTVTTKTFFIQLCTPSPFPFNICSARKK